MFFWGTKALWNVFLVEDEKYLVFGFAHQASLCLQKEVLVRVGVKKVQEKTCYHEQCVDG